jgi:hypothetical protein
MKSIMSTVIILAAALATVAAVGAARGSAQAPLSARFSDNLASVPAYTIQHHRATQSTQRW